MIEPAYRGLSVMLCLGGEDTLTLKTADRGFRVAVAR